MNFEEIERKLRVIHTQGLILPVALKEHGLTAPSIRKIVRGENYQMESLIEYVLSLGLLLNLNDYVIFSIKELSFVLKSVRYAEGIKQKTLYEAIKESYPSFTFSRICAVEKGRNFEKKTLLAYCAGIEKCCVTPLFWELTPGNVHLSYTDLKNL
ncbi:MAG: hypothetical protein IJR07_06910 [Bacteroidaceae bacterium]|nr:hypothetical protein [Bacteroidaceae bacterium]